MYLYTPKICSYTLLLPPQHDICSFITSSTLCALVLTVQQNLRKTQKKFLFLQVSLRESDASSLGKPANNVSIVACSAVFSSVDTRGCTNPRLTPSTSGPTRFWCPLKSLNHAEARLFHQFFVLGWETLELYRGGHMVRACNLMQYSSCGMIVLLICKVLHLRVRLRLRPLRRQVDRVVWSSHVGRALLILGSTMSGVAGKFLKSTIIPKQPRSGGRRNSPARDYVNWRQYNAPMSPLNSWAHSGAWVHLSALRHCYLSRRRRRPLAQLLRLLLLLSC